MDNTGKFVEDFNEKQRKHEQSQKRQSKANAGHQLPGKQHSTNK